MGREENEQHHRDLVYLSTGGKYQIDKLTVPLIFSYLTNVAIYTPESARRQVKEHERMQARWLARQSLPIEIEAVPLDIIESYARAGESGLARVSS